MKIARKRREKMRPRRAPGRARRRPPGSELRRRRSFEAWRFTPRRIGAGEADGRAGQARPIGFRPEKLHSSPKDGVEQELEGAFSLRAVLDAEPEHYNLTLTPCKSDGGGFALEALGAVGVAGDEDVFGVVGIPRDDAPLDVGRRGRGLEGDAHIDESGDSVRHAGADGTIGANVNAEERAGNVEVGSGGGGAAGSGARACQGVANRQIKFFTVD